MTQVTGSLVDRNLPLHDQAKLMGVRVFILRGLPTGICIPLALLPISTSCSWELEQGDKHVTHLEESLEGLPHLIPSVVCLHPPARHVVGRAS